MGTNVLTMRDGKLSLYGDSDLFLANYITAKDIEDILSASGGDLSLITSKTAQAISIKSAQLLRKRSERAKKATEYRKKRAEQVHNAIMNEILRLAEDDKEFTIAQLQIKAARLADPSCPCRTKQAYAYHLNKGIDDGIIETVQSGGCVSKWKELEVMTSSGKTITQRVPDCFAGVSSNHIVWRLKK